MYSFVFLFLFFFFEINFHFSEINIQEWVWSSYSSICLVFKKLFYRMAIDFIFPPAMYERFICFLSSWAFGFDIIFNFSYSHHGLNFHFSDGNWYWTSAHLLFSHPYIHFSEMSFLVCVFLVFIPNPKI